MAKATIDVFVDDLDGSEGAATIRIGWNGEWRELELSKRNLASLSRALYKYWNVARPAAVDGHSNRRRQRGATTATLASNPKRTTSRDPNLIRAWATDNGISVPTR